MRIPENQIHAYIDYLFPCLQQMLDLMSIEEQVEWYRENEGGSTT